MIAAKGQRLRSAADKADHHALRERQRCNRSRFHVFGHGASLYFWGYFTIMTKSILYAAALIAIACSGLSPIAFSAEPDDAAKDSNTVIIGTGLDYNTGKYGTRQTSRELSVPIMAAYDTENYAFEASIPYIWESGPAGTIAGARRTRLDGKGNIVREHGWGDVTTGITRFLIEDEDTGVSVDVKGIVKFATASQSKGLGTGKNDYSFQGDVSKASGRFGVFGTLGYSILGSPGNVVVTGVQEDIVFHNVFYGYLGATYKMTDKLKGGLTFHEEEASQVGGFQQRDLMASLTNKLTSSTKLQMYLARGLAKGSPAWDIGAIINTSF
jgi:hypothetical protein